MSFKIVTDSSSDVLSLNGVDFAVAPLKIITSENVNLVERNHHQKTLKK